MNDLTVFLDTYIKPILEKDQYIILNYGKFNSIPYPLPPEEKIPEAIRKAVIWRYNSIMSGKAPVPVYYATGIFRLVWSDKGCVRKEENMVAWLGFMADDIGTKIDIAKFYAFDKPPTFTIESSEGNFQYHYLVKVPLTNFSLVREFIRQSIALGLNDGDGGALVNKLVRLPSGVNNKHKRQQFSVQLGSCSGKKYDLYELAQEFGMDLAALRRAGNRAMREASRPTLLGYPEQREQNDSQRVLACLRDKGVISDEAYEKAKYSRSGMMDFDQCLWGHEHTDDPRGAALSPVGYGSGLWEFEPQFTCFHTSCKGRGFYELVEELVRRGWLEAVDVQETLVGKAEVLLQEARTHWVMVAGRIVDIRASVDVEPMPYRTACIQYDHRQIEIGTTNRGVPKFENVVKIWNRDDRKHTADGFKYAPERKRLFRKDGHDYINTWVPGLDREKDRQECGAETRELLDFLFDMICPPETNGQYCQDMVKAFLGEKVSNQSWHPPIALVSIAPLEGTGRGFLANIMAQLLGVPNVRNLSTEQMLKSQWTDRYGNSTMICCEEFYVGAPREREVVYGELRNLVTANRIECNEKFGKNMDKWVYCTLFLTTNYVDAIKISMNDRRFFVFRSDRDPTEGKYRWSNEQKYKRIHKLLATEDKQFLGECMDYFLEHQDQDIRNMGRAPVTAGMKAAILDTMDVIERAALEITKIGGLWPNKVIRAYIEDSTGTKENERQYMKRVKQVLRNEKWSAKEIKIGGKTHKAAWEGENMPPVQHRIREIEAILEPLRQISTAAAGAAGQFLAEIKAKPH